MPSVAASAGVLLSAEARAFAAALPVGMTTEPTVLGAALAVLVAFAASFLLVAGGRTPRVTMGAFFLLVGAGLGWALAAGDSLLAAAGIAVAAAVVGAVVQRYVPRLAVAVAASWPAAALWVFWRMSQGALGTGRSVAVMLLLVGAVVAGLLPSLAVKVLAAALGSLLAALAWPGEPSFATVGLVFAASLVWHLVLAPRLWPEPRSSRPSQEPLGAVVPRAASGAALALGGLVAVLVLLAPMPSAPAGVHAERVERLASAGHLRRPGLVLGAGDTTYLFGRGLPVALVTPRPGIVPRIGALVLAHSVSRPVHELRAVKDEGELASMRRAAAITSRAFTAIAPMIRPGVTEAELEGAILEVFRREGATGVAFPAVVASGPNAVLPHYMANDAVLDDGFVVIDIGCSVSGYASDMTRTFPVRRTYTEAQRHLMEVVLRVKDEARRSLKPGASLRALSKASHEAIEAAGFGPFYTHSLGHHVGLDVHDPGVDTLAPGMVVTLEPGIYVPGGAAVNPIYWNLGVRVEDSYLITTDGCEALTHFPEMPFAQAPEAEPTR